MAADHQRLPPYDYPGWQHCGRSSCYPWHWQNMGSKTVCINSNVLPYLKHPCLGLSIKYINTIRIRLLGWKSDLCIIQIWSPVIIFVYDCAMLHSVLSCLRGLIALNCSANSSIIIEDMYRNGTYIYRNCALECVG